MRKQFAEGQKQLIDLSYIPIMSDTAKLDIIIIGIRLLVAMFLYFMDMWTAKNDIS